MRHAVSFRQVMIGDDQIYTGAPGRFRSGKGANAGVDANDQPYAVGGGTLDDLVLHPIAVTKPMGDVEFGGAATQFDCGFEDDDRSGAVHVVVTVDKNA